MKGSYTCSACGKVNVLDFYGREGPLEIPNGNPLDKLIGDLFGRPGQDHRCSCGRKTRLFYDPNNQPREPEPYSESPCWECKELGPRSKMIFDRYCSSTCYWDAKERQQR